MCSWLACCINYYVFIIWFKNLRNEMKKKEEKEKYKKSDVGYANEWKIYKFPVCIVIILFGGSSWDRVFNEKAVADICVICLHIFSLLSLIPRNKLMMWISIECIENVFATWKHCQLFFTPMTKAFHYYHATIFLLTFYIA